MYVGDTSTFQNSGSSPQSKTWYHLDLAIDNPNHKVTLTVNGSVLVSATQNQFTDKTHTIMLGVGAVDYCNNGRAHQLQVDNVKLSISGSSSPTPTPTPAASPTPTPMPTVTPTPTPTITPTPTATPNPTPTLTPSPTPTPTATPTPTPKPTATPTSTASPTPTPTTPPSGVVFSDDFISGNFNQWTTKYTSTGASQSVSSGTAQFNAPSGGNGVSSYVGKSSFSSTSTGVITASQDIYMTEVPSGFSAGLGAIFILAILDTSNNGNILVSVDGSQKWGIYIGESTFTYALQTSGPNPQSRTWYHLDLTIDNPNQKVTLAVNGSTVVSATQNQFTGSTHSIDLATGIIQDWCNNGRTHQLQVDNVKLGMSGSTPPTPTPTPTINPTISPTPIPTATPTPNPTVTPTPTINPSPTPTPTGTPTYKQQTLSVPITASWIASDATVYAGINNAVYKSTDGGQTWTGLLSFGSNVIIHYVYVSKQDYVFICPDTNALEDQLGIWRSTNGGQTWSRVLALPAGCTTMSMAEDSNGNLFVGVYTTGSYAANARIYKSTDGGSSWTSVYYDSAARHVHCVTVDPANNYVYASIGDVRVWNGITGSNWDIEYVVRSNDDGNSGTWTKILQGTANAGDAQMIAIHIVDTVGAGGVLTPSARLFATDYNNGQIYRTTDDTNFNLVLDTGAQSYGFWVRTNSLNGVIYASFVGGDGSPRTAGIWTSTDDGLHWSKYMDFPVNQPNQGSTTASNFHQGVLYFNVMAADTFQNAIKLYPEYSESSIMPLNVEAGALTVAAAQWVILCAMSTIAMVVLVNRKINRTKANMLRPL